MGEKLYASTVTDRLYARLEDCADAALAAGLKVIVDASFLEAAQRERLRQVAIRRGVPLLILSCHASIATLYARLEERARAGLDPSEATRDVLHHQLATQEPLTPQESTHALRIDTDAIPAVEVVVTAIQDRLGVR